MAEPSSGLRVVLAGSRAGRTDGHNADDLVMKWGPPDKEYDLSDGRRMLTYYGAPAVQTGGGAYRDSVYDYRTGTTVYVERRRPTQTHHCSCTTGFVVNTSGIVVDWRFKGNDCTFFAPD